jgi:hypothetical protein
VTDFDPIDVRGQERAKAERASRDRLARESEEGDVRWLMSNKRGRRIVWRLLDQGGVFRLSFNTNAMTMAFAEGNRNFSLRLLALLHTLCPELYPVMVKENANGNAGDEPGPNDH